MHGVLSDLMVYSGIFTTLPKSEPGMINIANHKGIPSCRKAIPAAWMKNKLSIAKASKANTEKLRFPCCNRT